VFVETFKFTKARLESLPPADSGQVEYGDTVVNGLRAVLAALKASVSPESVMANSSGPRLALRLIMPEQRLSNCWGTLQPLEKSQRGKTHQRKGVSYLADAWIPTSRAATQD
jgi:hypothetical protein